MNEFKFVTDDGFFIWNVCTVFHGYVELGEIQTDDQIEFKSTDGVIHAKVKMITKVSNREIIEESVQNEKIAIAIDRFEKEPLNTFWNNYKPNTDEVAPTIEEVLKIKYPLIITKRSI